MRVLVFEPDHTGHRLNYVRLLLAALVPLVQGRGSVTLVAGRPAQSSPEFADQLAGFRDRVQVLFEVDKPTGGPVGVARSRLGSLRGTLRRHGADHLYVPSADGLSQLLGARRLLPGMGWPRGMTSEAGMHRGAWAYPAPGLRRRAEVWASRTFTARSPWTRIHHVDPLAYEWIARRGGALAARSVVLPDPVEPPPPLDRQQARARLGVPQDGRIIGCAGGINKRKGIDRLVRAFARASLRPDDRLLLCGKADAYTRAALDRDGAELRRAGRLVEMDRYLTEDELVSAIAAMDVVTTPYAGHVGLSNIALRAAGAGRMVLGDDAGWQRRVIPAFGLGAVCDVRDTDAYAGAIGAALDAAPGFAPSDATRRLLEFHSPANFAAGWTGLLRERLGLGPDPAWRSWAWATGRG